MAQVVVQGPEFKPQYNKKKNERKSANRPVKYQMLTGVGSDTTLQPN
jgi:hypothetical protein